MKKPDENIEEITPYQAALYLLQAGETGRAVNQRHVNMLAAEMTKCEWDETRLPIVFDDDGRLIDGMHRLLAVIQSLRPVRMAVIKGGLNNDN